MTAAIDWGDLPTWLSAVAALSALVFAAVAVVVARRTFRIESARDQVATQAGRRAQAVLVSAWCQEREMYLRNASPSPVYQTRLTVVDLADRAAGPLYRLGVDVLPPAADPRVFGFDLPDAADARVSLTFTDAAGVRWHRDEYGRLGELESRLSIWGAERMESVLNDFSADLSARYGIALTCHTPDWAARWQTYLDAGRDGTLADVLDAPNDIIGVLAEQGVIQPIVLTADQRDRFLPWTLTALTYRGRLYGVPLTAQKSALIRNLDLAPAAPAVFDEIGDFIVQSELFHYLAIFAAAGGDVFGVGPDGRPDTSRVRVAEPPSLAALETLADLRPLRRTLDETGARQEFLTGRSPYLIGLSEDLTDARAAGMRCAVTAIPPFRGRRPGRQFASVRGFLLSRGGANQLIARDLVPDYLARIDVARMATRQCMPTCLRDYDPHDPDVAALLGAPDGAVPMPSHPRMIKIWSLLHGTLHEIIAGADVATGARRLDRQLRHVLADD